MFELGLKNSVWTNVRNIKPHKALFKLTILNLVNLYMVLPDLSNPLSHNTRNPRTTPSSQDWDARLIRSAGVGLKRKKWPMSLKPILVKIAVLHLKWPIISLRPNTNSTISSATFGNAYQDRLVSSIHDEYFIKNSSATSVKNICRHKYTVIRSWRVTSDELKLAKRKVSIYNLLIFPV